MPTAAAPASRMLCASRIRCGRDRISVHPVIRTCPGRGGRREARRGEEGQTMTCLGTCRDWLVVVAVALAGCAPVAVVKQDPRIKDQQYRTLVLADFENAIGDALPPRVQQE